jgi:hypothetical protein
LKYYNMWLEIEFKIQGKDNPLTAISFNNIGLVKNKLKII